MMTKTSPIAQVNLPGQLRKMNLGEFDRFTELIETAFAEDQAREGRNFRDEVRSLSHLLPLFRIMFAIAPSLENYFYTLVWDAGGHFASAVTIMRQGNDAQRWNHDLPRGPPRASPRAGRLRPGGAFRPPTRRPRAPCS